MGDGSMREVPVQTFSGRAITATKGAEERYTADELDRFAKYYGAHPDLLEGFAYVHNTERKAFLADVTEKKWDVTMK